MHGLAQPEEKFPPTGADNADAKSGGRGPSLATRTKLGDEELNSALQLLVERAQYITGATGAALALPQGGEMVCRASAGGSAPGVGARLQVQSGLTGESVARKQLLRCDNAESDPRVNLEACRALGIASIVVMPLLRKSGEIRGLFELFSDHPYAFEERDLVALERMGDLTHTALDLAEQTQNGGIVPAVTAPAVAKPAAPAAPVVAADSPVLMAKPMVEEAPVEVVRPKIIDTVVEPPTAVAPEVAATPVEPSAAQAPIPEAMFRVQKCASCGFPVSEGRTLCLDCEKKERDKPAASAAAVVASEPEPAASEEELPAFLANAQPVQHHWYTDHVNLLAIAVVILGALVAVVVFR